MRSLLLCSILSCLACAESSIVSEELEPTDREKADAPVTETAAPSTTEKPTSEVVPEKLTGQDPVAVSIVGEPISVIAAKCVEFSPDGNWLAIGLGNGRLRLWSVHEQKVARAWNAHDSWTFDLQFSTDSQSLWTGGGDNRVRRWEVATGEVQDRFEDHKDDVHGISVSTDGTRLISGADDFLVIVRNLENDTVHELKGHAEQVTAIALGAGDTLIASASRDDSVRLWHVETRELRHELSGHTLDATSVAFSHDGTRLLTASRDRTARIWEVATGKLLHTFDGHDDWVFTARWMPGEEVIATGSKDRHLRLIRIENNETVTDLPLSSNVADIAVSPDGKLLAVAESAGIVHVYKIEGESLAPSSVIPPESTPPDAAQVPETSTPESGAP